MNTYPVELNKLPDGRLSITWSDDVTHWIEVRTLRKSCQCANCRASQSESEPESALRVLTPAETMPLQIDSMQPVGNYAYNVHFSDGHTTGIFTFEHLRRLGAEAE